MMRLLEEENYECKISPKARMWGQKEVKKKRWVR